MTDKIDEQLASIDDVIAGGESSFQHEDRKIVYRSLAELERIKSGLVRKKSKRRPILATKTNISREL